MQAALGFRTHSGWAAVVAATAESGLPAVVGRWEIDLCDTSIRGSKQPYHTAEPMPLSKAAAFLHRCTVATDGLAVRALQTIAAELEARERARGSGRPAARTCWTCSSPAPTGWTPNGPSPARRARDVSSGRLVSHLHHLAVALRHDHQAPEFVLQLHGFQPRMERSHQVELGRCQEMVQRLADTMGFMADQVTAIVWRGPKLSGALQQLTLQTLWSDLDYLIIDMPPGMPLVQYPHCAACSSRKARCTGCNSSAVPSPSNVVIDPSVASATGTLQDLIALAPSRTVHAPQLSEPQPNCGPFKPRSFRST